MGGTGPAGGAAAKTVLGVLLSGAAFVVFALFGGGTAYGLGVTGQDAEVNNVGVGIANSGGNTAVGNVSGPQTAVNGQAAVTGGGVATNEGRASNESSGDASIVTGSANAAGNQSATGVNQGAASAGGGPVNVVLQDGDVNNTGVGVANSGNNVAIGNVNGPQTAVSGQLAVSLGGLAFNASSASNVSSGSASIVTGAANAAGNQSATNVNQGSVVFGGLFGPSLGIVVQDVDVTNVGVGIANTGGNLAVGNVSGPQTALNLQLALGLGGLGVNTGAASNVSTGTATILTGGGTAIGNQASTITTQNAVATGDALGLEWFLPWIVFIGLARRRS